jgi:hypothetical protein
MKRGQQSTTNKRGQNLTAHHQPVICSATNRQKKVFNFGEIDEPNPKMQLMKQLLLNQNQVLGLQKKQEHKSEITSPHAHYFEAAAVTSQIKTQGGNTVININIAAGPSERKADAHQDQQLQKMI